MSNKDIFVDKGISGVKVFILLYNVKFYISKISLKLFK